MNEKENKEKEIKVEGGPEQKPESPETEQPQEAEKAEDQQETEAPKEEEKDPVAELQKQVDELKDKYLRQVAEFDNYKKRTLKEKAELILNGSERSVAAILPTLDDMERAIANAGKNDDAKQVEEGWELIYKKLVKALETLGVKKMETEDADFDVDYHEAVAMVPGMGDDKKGKVIDCLQAGYMLNDKVLRHAKVAVGQ